MVWQKAGRLLGNKCCTCVEGAPGPEGDVSALMVASVQLQAGSRLREPYGHSFVGATPSL